MTRRRPAAAVAAAVVAVLLVAACSSGGGRAAPAAGATDRGGPVRLVVIGDQRAFGEPARDTLHASWPQLLFRTKLPSRTVYTNLAEDHATVADAQRIQVPEARSLKPTLAVVWLGQGDDEEGTDPGDYGVALRALVDDLTQLGTEVVVISDDHFAGAATGLRGSGAKIADVSGVDVASGTPASQQQVSDAVSASIGTIS